MTKVRMRVQQLTFEEMLDELGEYARTGEVESERYDNGWELDPDDEDDRSAVYVFGRTNLDSTNPKHRDLLLEWLLAGAPIGGAPPTPDVQKLCVLRQVDAAKRDLATRRLPSDNKAACLELARRYRKVEPTWADPLGKMKPATILSRYYAAVREFRLRLNLKRFQRNYSQSQLDEIARLIGAT